MKKLISFILTILLLTSTACANGNNKAAKSSIKGELSNMKISIQITSDSGSHKLTATLADNSSALAFYELLKKGPLTVMLNEYGEFEKVGSLGTTLPRSDRQTATNQATSCYIREIRLQFFTTTTVGVIHLWARWME